MWTNLFIIIRKKENAMQSGVWIIDVCIGWKRLACIIGVWISRTGRRPAGPSPAATVVSLGRLPARES